MKFRLLKSGFSASIIALAAQILANSPAFAQTPSFFCGAAGGRPATIAVQQGKNIPVILWLADNYFNESGEDAITRCTRVSGILNNSQPQGSWDNIVTAGASSTGQLIICAANPQDGSCRLLYQVPKGQNPEQARQELLKRVTSPNVSVSPVKVN
ncbi:MULTISPECIES: COP23 domain-containing protein [unclassified Microcoleus]|uniref:COP23 domain-containing protein n=1 Tax=unclassified Microcoleus TaxID=2642155 RepID=UPI002FD64DF2